MLPDNHKIFAETITKCFETKLDELTLNNFKQDQISKHNAHKFTHLLISNHDRHRKQTITWHHFCTVILKQNVSGSWHHIGPWMPTICTNVTSDGEHSSSTESTAKTLYSGRNDGDK